MTSIVRSALITRALVVPLAAFAITAPAAAQCTGDYIPGQGFRGLNLGALDFATWDADGKGPLEPVLLAAGSAYAGNVYSGGVAAWDGTQWNALGGVTGPSASVITIFEGDVITGGYVTGGDTAVNRWDGSTWTPMPGIGIYIEDLAVYRGELYAAGSFQIQYGSAADFIAKWDGDSWEPLEGTTNGPVNALFVYNDELIVGGEFTSAGGVPVNYVASWNGKSWASLGAGVSGGTGVAPGPRVNALGEYNGELIVGGNFRTVGPLVVENIARWNGAAWAGFTPEGFSSPSTPDVFSFTNFEGDLIVGGKFTRVGGANTFYIARWNGSAWSAIGGGMRAGADAATVYALGVHDGRLFAGGAMQQAGDVPVVGLAQWDGVAWDLVGDGLTREFRTFTTYNGELLGAGPFTAIDDDREVLRIARWNGTKWEDFGHGVNDTIAGLGVYNGDLIVTGSFVEADNDVFVRNIARWDGSQWHGLGSGIDGNAGPTIVYNGDLIVGGRFTSAGGVTAANIARWDGTQWHALGAGIPGQFSFINALAIYQGDLIVAGDFETAGTTPASCIARWDGSQWHALGAGFDTTRGSPNVGEMVVYQNDLVVVGRFDSAGGAPAANIARWNGSAWSTFGSGLTQFGGGWAGSIVIYNGDLVVSGNFGDAGGVPTRYIARWDGDSWGPIGPNATPAVFPINALYAYGAELFGATNAAISGNGRLSAGYLRWRDCCAADFNADGTANSQDFFDFLTAFFKLEPSADFNGDAVINSQDFFDFLTAFFDGCQ